MQKKKPEYLSEFAPFMTMGLELAIYIVVFTFLGYWLDGKLGTLPVFTILLALTGLFGGFYKFFKRASKINNKKKEQS
jgi:F0F1-type ATP synthase assembly protein I